MIPFTREEILRAIVAIAVDIYMGIATKHWNLALGVLVIELVAGVSYKWYTSRTSYQKEIYNDSV